MPDVPCYIQFVTGWDIIEAVKEKRIYFLSSFGGRESILPATHSTHDLLMRYFDANSLYNDLSGWNSDDLYVAIIFKKPPTIEDLYIKFLENNVGFSRSEIQSADVRNEVKHEKFNEAKRHTEYLFPFDNGANLFMVKLAETVMVNCVWDPGINPKTMHRNALPWLVNIQPNLRKIALNRPLLSAELSSQIVSLDLILFGTNSLFQLVLKNTMPLKDPPGAWGGKKKKKIELLKG